MKTEIEYTDAASRTQAIADNPSLRLVADHRSRIKNTLVFTDEPPPVSHKNEYRKLPIATLDPAQVDTYIDNNVTNIASAKTVLKLLAKGLIRVAKNGGM